MIDKQRRVKTDQQAERIKELEQQLAEAHAKGERFAKIFQASPDALVLSRLEDGIMLEINDSFQTLFGYPREAVIGKSSLEINLYMDPSDRQEIVQIIKVQGFVRDYKLEMRNRSGEAVQVIFFAEVITVNNEPHMLVILRDVTERKQVELALAQVHEEKRESETRYSQLADSMPQLVWTARPDGTVDYYNQRYKEYDGIEPVSGEIWEWAPVLHPDDVQTTVDHWTRALRTGEMYQVEHRVRMADGTYRWHLSRGIPAYNDDGQIIRWYGTATDIHDNKLAEQKLQAHTERLALLSEAAGDLLTTDDPLSLLDKLFQRLAGLLDLEIYVHYRLSEDGTYLKLGALAGFPEDARKSLERLEVGRSVCGIVAATQHRVLVEDVQQSSSTETKLIRSLGITAYVCYPLVVHGKVIGTLSFGTRSRTHFEPASLDLILAVCNLIATAIDRRQNEVALKDYADRLERSNRELQEFAFVASHDLQEPLRKIEAFGEQLVQGATNLDERQLDHLSRMQKSANRMRAMVDGLLELSRVATQARRFEPVDLSRVVADVLTDLEHQVHRKGARVEVSQLPVLAADPLQMRQLFLNLIGNALKFQNSGTNPRVRVYSRRSAPGTCQIFVEDNGIGFDMAHAGRLFQPFHRLVGRSEFDGSGMGLAICRRIAERHGGDIRAESSPGQGTTFIVTLPEKAGDGKQAA